MARDPPKQRTRAERFRLKAAECVQLAENARFAETRRIYAALGDSYELLAKRAEEHPDEKLSLQDLRSSAPAKPGRKAK